MFRASRLIVLSLAATAVLGSTACADNYYGNRYPQSYPNARVDDRAYRDGFDSGRAAGIDDARRGRSFDYSRHREYRDVSGGSRNSYDYSFRQGFTSGYDEGFRRYAGTNQYPSSGPYYDPRSADPRYGGGTAVYRTPAADNGYRDGYAAGRDDGRDNDRFNPRGASRYRDGDHDYNSRYGSRDEYKREYRAAFEQGYDQGYREARRR